MKDYDENKESLYLQYWDVNNLYGWVMLHKLQEDNFEWIKDTSKFNENFIKTILKKVMNDISLKLMFKIFKNYMNINHFSFLIERMKIEKVEKLVTNLQDETE